MVFLNLVTNAGDMLISDSLILLIKRSQQLLHNNINEISYITDFSFKATIKNKIDN